MKIIFKNEIIDPISPDKIVDILLKNREIKDIPNFLNPPDPLQYSLSDFGFKKGEINNVLKTLAEIYKKNQMIVVYTDYDADGITGGAIMWETLHLLGFKVMPYVPHRKSEGYGFSRKGIDAVVKEFHPKLIISVDHGITSKVEVDYANKIGIDILITDHHHKQEEKVPVKALAIFHIPELSGSGTAYIVAKEIYNHFKTKNKNLKIIKHNFQNDYLGLATIGTIADLVPLVGKSRSIVAHGLGTFSKNRRPGIRALFDDAKIKSKKITPYEIGFMIAPRINAVGRLEHAIDALRLLCTVDKDRADKLAGQIGNLNIDRQMLVRDQVAEAISMLEKNKTIPKIIVLHSNSWHEGVIGLIAGNILEKYYRPTIVMTKSEDNFKGSVRSIPGFHITDFLSNFKKILVGYGGHAAAAGFTVMSKNRVMFTKLVVKNANKMIDDKILDRKLEVDLKIPLSTMSKKLFLLIDKMGPFGMGNSKPLFVSEVMVSHARILGKQRQHLKLEVKDAKISSFTLEMIAFGKAEIFSKLSKNQVVRVVYTLDINQWNGTEKVQGIVKHIEL